MKNLFLLLLSIAAFSQLNAQTGDTLTVSVTLHRVSLDSLATELEKRTGLRLFFDETQFRNHFFDLQVESVSVDSALRQAFAATNLKFARDQQGNVFITRNYALYFGKENQRRTIRPERGVTGDTSQLLARSPFAAAHTLGEVTVSASLNIRSSQLGVQKIDIRTIRQVPVVFGEADVLRVVMAMPGVKTVGEASTGLNVRGGSADQNLILFNDATIYNPAHFFGMFSAFNPDIIKDVTLYKSSMPARYGGKLSSVLEITSREGNRKKFSGSAGIGLLTSRITLEGPIKKDRSSFIVGARSTYANWMLNLLPAEYDNSKASFYDVHANVSHTFNSKNDINVSAYASHDRFNLNNDTTYGYDNRNFSLRWKHAFNTKMTGIFSAGSDYYKYQVESSRKPEDGYQLKFDITQYFLRAHFNWYVNNSHTVEYGVNTLRYNLNPGTFRPIGNSSRFDADRIEREQAYESAIYISDKYDLSAAFSIEAGLRYSLFNYVGPRQMYRYAAGVPKSEQSLIDSVQFSAGSNIKTYSAPEFRIALRYSIDENTSVKAAFNSQRQYIHMMSNTAAMAPTDIWKLSDSHIRPQSGRQVSLGLYRNLAKNTIETSLEVYYKQISDYLDYKSGANLIMNHHLETDVIGTKGKAYGIELLVKKSSGKLSGWIGYTWSRILLKQDDPDAGEIISNGRYYPANYDKPHDLTFTGNYKINHRFSLSLNGNYSTGRPITIPVGRYFFSGSYRTLYDDRNAHRIPDYFRADFSMNIEGNHKVKQKTHNSWTIGVYNLTGRRNPYSVYYVSEGGAINGYKLSIFGSAIPFITFNIRF